MERLLSAFIVLMPGVEHAELGGFHVVRIDPAIAHVTAVSGKAATAGAWCKKEHLAVAINAGMFEEDFTTHSGFFRIDDRVQSSAWSSKYQSVLAFGGSEPLVMIDRDDTPEGFDEKKYRVVIQNLRLIKGTGAKGTVSNVWSKSDKKWSEAAIAFDDQGRLLFVFSRAPYSMRDFNAKLLLLGIGVRRAQHVEGGPEASLSIHAGGVNLDLAGSYETGFNENDDNVKQWPVPNIIGVGLE